MTKMIKNLSDHGQANLILLKLLLISIFLILIFNFYFVSITVNAAVENRTSIKKSEALNQEYHKLETRYISLLGKIDMDYARLSGFIDQSKKMDYAARQGALATKVKPLF